MQLVVSIWDRLDFFEGRSDLYVTIEKQVEALPAGAICRIGSFSLLS